MISEGDVWYCYHCMSMKGKCEVMIDEGNTSSIPVMRYD